MYVFGEYTTVLSSIPKSLLSRYRWPSPRGFPKVFGKPHHLLPQAKVQGSRPQSGSPVGKKRGR